MEGLRRVSRFLREGREGCFSKFFQEMRKENIENSRKSKVSQKPSKPSKPSPLNLEGYGNSPVTFLRKKRPMEDVERTRAGDLD